MSPRGAQFYAYPWDLADEGVDEASGAIARATGPGGGVLLALSYHVSTYFSPHNPLRKLYYGEEGAVYFVPDESLYADTTMRPLVSKVVTGTDYMKDLARGIGRNGLGFEAWSVYFYNHHLPQAFPDVARRDCFGQPYLAQVCPAGPDARQYAVALTRDMLPEATLEQIVASAFNVSRCPSFGEARRGFSSSTSRLATGISVNSGMLHPP